MNVMTRMTKTWEHVCCHHHLARYIAAITRAALFFREDAGVKVISE